jgi:hypothetical protein
MESPAGTITISIAEGALSVRRWGTVLLQTNLIGTLTDLRLEVDRLSFTLNGSTRADSFVRVAAGGRCVLSARAGERDLAATMEAGSILVTGFERHEGESAVAVLWA